MDIALFCIASFLLSLFINWFLLRYSGKRFAKDAPENSKRWETVKKPAMGGISFFVGIIFSVLVFFLFFPPQTFNDIEISVILCTISLSFTLGLYDDFRNAPVTIKFGIQFLIAFALLFFGIGVNITHNAIIDAILTVLWVVGLTNSLNMLDNMDGVTALVSVFILVGITVFASLHGVINPLHQLIMLGLATAICGFLCFNFHPSKMYMGDAGSLTLGCTLAIFSIIYLWNPDLYAADASTWSISTATKQVLIIFLIFIVPLTDTVTVFIKRLAKGKSPFVGDKGHTTHHLFYIGVKQTYIPLLLGLITTIGIGLSLLLGYFVQTWNPLLIIGCIAYLLLVFFTLFFISLKNTEKD